MSPARQAAGPPNGDRAGVPEPSAASWRQAESELFSGLLQRPDVYEEVVALVGATVDRLRGLEPTAAALLEAADTVAALVRELAEQRGRAAPGADPLLLGRAALAVRHREVVAHAVAAHRLAQLRDARAATPHGSAWVVLDEVGEWAGDPLVPYRRLEAEASTGRAVLVTATPDEDFRASRHAVQVVQVDLGTGRVEPSPGAFERARSCVDATAREATAAALRVRLSGGG
jgi:hypothetical protein